MKRAVLVLLCLILAVMLSGCDTGIISEEFDKINEVFSRLTTNYSVVETDSEAATLKPSEIIENENYFFCYQKLNKRQKNFYRIFLTVAEEMPKDFINLGVYDDSSMVDIMISYRAMLYDHPEIFWMPYTYIIGYNKQNEKPEILTAFDHKPAELLENIGKSSLESGKAFNFVKHSCTDSSNTYYAKNGAVISSDFSKAARVIEGIRDSGEEFACVMLADEKTRKMFDEDIESAVDAVQRKLYTMSLKQYSQVRDIIVFYWN